MGHLQLSPYPWRRLGGILAIDELIDMQCEESETKTMVLRFA